MIMALNMMDELTASGGSIDIKKIEDRLTVPVVPITANSGAGVDELLSRAQKTAHDKKCLNDSTFVQASLIWQFILSPT